MQQTGGTNSTTYLTIGAGGRYQSSGGTLQVGSGLLNQGTFDGGNSSGTLEANCLVDLTSGTWTNLGTMSVNMGANSLLIVPAGFNTATGFGSFTTQGLVHTAGTTLTVPAGKGFGGWGSINDPVNLPRHDHGRQRRGHQPEQRLDPLGQRQRLPGIQRDPDRQRYRLRHERRNALR